MLAQRMSYAEKTGSKGVDAFTKWDYMGAAEYEYGQLYDNVQLLRALDLVMRRFEHEGHEIFFIGREEDLDSAKEAVKFEGRRYKCNAIFPWEVSSSRAPGGWVMNYSYLVFVLFVDATLAMHWAQELGVEIP